MWPTKETPKPSDPVDVVAVNTGKTADNTKAIDTAIGVQSDTPATTDSGTFSLIALFKRLLGSTTDLITAVDDIGVTTPITVTSKPNEIDPNNTTDVALDGGGVFTGTSTEILAYSQIIVQCFSDKNSATDGLVIQLSTDNTNWTDHTHSVTVAANTLGFLSVGASAKYYRVKYTNGGTGQTTFRLTSILCYQPQPTEAISISDPIVGTDHATLAKSVVTGKTTGGGSSYVDVKVSPSGAVQVGGTLDGITALPLPTGAATEAKQDTGNTSIGNVDTNLGAKADVAAGSDTGTYSLISLFKRLLQGITTLNAFFTNTYNQVTNWFAVKVINFPTDYLKPADTLTKVATVDTITNSVPTLFPVENMSAFGTLETAEMTPIIQGDFVYGINKQIWAYNYVFTVTSPAAAPAYGDLYTNSNNYYMVLYSSGTTLVCAGTGDPSATGNLTRATGSGSTPIAYSAFTTSAGVTNGTGATIDTNVSRLRIQSGTSSTGYSYLLSRRPIRYRAGQGTTARFTPLFTSGSADNIQLWGLGSLVNNAPYDGYFFGYNGTSFGIAHYTAGTPVWYSQDADWNKDKVNGTPGTAFNWNKTYGSPVMIKYPYLGYGDILFFVQNPSTGRWVLVHVISYANTSASTQLSNPTMNFMGYTKNSGNTSNKIMYCGSVGVFISGVRSFIGNPKYGIDKTNDAITSTESNILTIRNCLFYNGVYNRGLIRLNQIALGLKEATVVTLRFKINATLGGTPSFAAVDGTISNGGMTITSGNSVASYDTAGTTITAGVYRFNLTLGASGTEAVDLTPHEIFVAPGEQLVISGVATGNSTVGLSLNWSEDI